MGFFDDAASMISGRPPSKHHRSSSHKHHKSSSGRHHHSSHRDKSHSRSRSRSGSRHRAGFAASIFGGGSDYHKHNSSKASFFSLNNASRGSFFGFGGGRTPSYYKRSPRPSFISRAYKKLKRLLRDLVHYAKRHPLKVFMLVIMPLLTGGALTALLARFGLRVPAGLERMMGLGAKAMSGDGVGLVGEAVRMATGSGLAGAAAGAAGRSGSVSVARGWDEAGGRSWERRSMEGDLVGSTLGSLGGLAGGGGGWMGSVAKMFS